jgi:hypothetical protein
MISKENIKFLGIVHKTLRNLETKQVYLSPVFVNYNQ